MPVPQILPVFAAIAFQAFMISYGRVINEQSRRMRKRAWAKTSEAIRLALAPETKAIEVVTPLAIAAVNYERDEGERLELEPAPDPIFD